MSDDEESFHSADEGDGNEATVASVVESVRSPRKSSAILQLQDEEPDHEDPKPKKITTSSERKSSSSSRPTDLRLNAAFSPASPPKEETDTTIEQITSYVSGTIKKVTESARISEAEKNAPVTDGWDVDWGAEADDDDDFDPSDMVTPSTEFPAGKLVLDVDTPQAEKATHSGNKNNGSSEAQSLWSGWGGQGWSILTAASDGITNLKQTVGEGFTDVIETVHSGLGVPTPEELAKMSAEEKLELVRKANEVKEPWPSEDHDDCGSHTDEVCSNSGSDGGAKPGVDGESSSGYQSDSVVGGAFASLSSATPSLFSGVTNTGRSLVTGSFDVLEALGKKTFDVLTVTDEDAGGRRRFILSQQNTNLSQVLRDRKMRSEAETQQQQAEANAKLGSYTYHFEKLEGLVQLEGLEMVSANCARQLETMEIDTDAVRDQLAAVADVFAEYLDSADSYSEELEHDFEQAIGACIDRLALPYNCTKLIATQGARRYYIENVVSRQADGIHAGSLDVFHKAIESMADLTARSVEALHKMSQLLLISYSTKLEPRALVELADVLCNEVGIVSCRFSDAYNAASKNENLDTDIVGEKITSLFLEANNSCNYIRESLRLLLPVLQFAIVDINRKR